MNQEKKTRMEFEERRKKLVDRRENDWKDWKIDEYAGKPFYPTNKAGKILCDVIKSDKPALVGRLGETELRTYKMFKYDYLHLDQLRRATFDICNNAGFFPRRIKDIKRFCNLYDESAMNADYFAMLLWQDEEFYLSHSNKLRCAFSAAILDPILCGLNNWMDALAGKEVLVVSPFAKSIEKQYGNRDSLFKNGLKLPEFDLKTVKAIQSVGGKGADGFDSWFDALRYMEDEISRLEFDIALLGCGAYGMPLGLHIKNMGKQAIYMGGGLQLMFGIIGKRWEAKEYIREAMNEKWVRPSLEEIPRLFDHVEDGCYW